MSARLTCAWALISLLISAGLSACEEPTPEPKTEPLCGPGELAVGYGYGRPLEPLTDGELLIEYGLQGGYHVDVSLRFTGELNPDLVDVQMGLEVTDGENPEGVYGEHDTREWYLLFPEEGEPVGCYFYRARVFLFDERGEIPTESMVEGLDGVTATLQLTLTHDGGTYNSAERFPLRFVPPSP